MARRKTNAAVQTKLIQPQTTKRTSIVPVTLRECKQFIYNLFAKPKYSELKVTKRAYIKLMCYINLIGDYEISGFGRIQEGTITDFKILKQEVKPAYVECDEDAVLEFIRSIPRNELAEWELDWHSHVNMGVTPSGTDWKNYESMSELRGHKQFPVMIINKKQEYTLLNYISEDNSEDIELTITDEEITQNEIDEIYEETKRDIKEKCTKEIQLASTYSIYGKQTIKQEKTSYPTYQDYYSAYNHNYDSGYGYDYDDEIESVRCKSCHTPLLNSHELTTGFCEDCEEAVEKEKGELQNGKL